MKKYKIKVTHDRIPEKVVEETLEDLIGYFSYTLEIGNSWNNKIQRKPKTIKSFVKHLQMAYEEKEGSCYERTFIELIK